MEERGTLVRLLNDEGEPFASPPAGPLHGRFVVIGWPKADAETTHATETAIAARNKPALDLLGQSNKLGWCELGVRSFEYDAYWARFPDELDEYEESIEADTLSAIKASRTLYSLRSGLRPIQCGKLVDLLAATLQRATNGTFE